MTIERRIYEPLRMLKARDWASQLLMPLARGDRKPFDTFKQSCADTELLKDITGKNDVAALGAMARMMIYLRYSSTYGKKKLAHIGRREEVYAMTLAAMVLGGRHIVHFTKDITDALLRTDSPGLTVDDLNLPWDAFYLAFDGDAIDEQGMRLDGVLIATDPDTNTTKLVPLITGTNIEDYHGVWFADLRKGHDRDLLKSIVQNLGAIPQDLEPDAEILDHPMTRLMARNAPLIANALLYLSAEPDTGDVRWQDGAPAKLVTKANATGPQAIKATRELQYSHWNQVRYIGSPKTVGQGQAPGAHWVKGHIRRQAHGKGRAERKLIWIRPHVSGGTLEEANAKARVRIVATTD